MTSATANTGPDDLSSINSKVRKAQQQAELSKWEADAAANDKRELDPLLQKVRDAPAKYAKAREAADKEAASVATALSNTERGVRAALGEEGLEELDEKFEEFKKRLERLPVDIAEVDGHGGAAGTGESSTSRKAAPTSTAGDNKPSVAQLEQAKAVAVGEARHRQSDLDRLLGEPDELAKRVTKLKARRQDLEAANCDNKNPKQTYALFLFTRYEHSKVFSDIGSTSDYEGKVNTAWSEVVTTRDDQRRAGHELGKRRQDLDDLQVELADLIADPVQAILKMQAEARKPVVSDAVSE